MADELITINNGQMSFFDRITDPLAFIDQMGKTYAMAGVGGAKNESQGRCLVMACLAKKMDPFEFASQYHLIEGKPQLQAHVILARMKQGGNKAKWLKDGEDLIEASIEVTTHTECRAVSYKMSDAVTAGVVKPGSAWDKSPSAMLRAACIRKAAKMLTPEILFGDVDPEEFVEPPAGSGPSTTQRSATDVEARRRELEGMSAGAGDVEVKPIGPVESEADRLARARREAEATPFDVPVVSATAVTTVPAESPAMVPDATLVLMEIETLIGQVGMTKAQLEEGLRAQTPDFKSLDDLTPAKAQRLLENLRAKIGKK